MKAIVLRERGGPEVLRPDSVEDPTAGPGEVVIKLRAAALNHRDVWIRSGAMAIPTSPLVLGSDGAGDVVAVGAGVDESWKGKDVVINPGLDWGDNPRVSSPAFRILGGPDHGTYAELVKAPVTNIHPKPSRLRWDEAAAIPLAALTAYRAVVSRAAVRAGDVVLVTGIGGGVAQYALMIATHLGARVIVTSGTAEKIERARQLGAEDGVSYRDPDWPAAVQRVTGGNGPDAVIDGTGGETLVKAVAAVRPGGRIVNYGGTGGPIQNLQARAMYSKQIDILGTAMGSPHEFAEMIALVEKGDLRPIVDSHFPLNDAAAAHQRMERAEQFGKIVLQIA